MAKTTPQAAAARWAQGLSGAAQKIQAGVEATTTPPGMAAARQKAVWVQQVTANADKWATRTAAVPLQDWQQSMVTKGIPRIGQGAQAAEGKFADFLSQFLPHVDRVVAGLPARGNLEANLNRMVANARGMAQFQRR